MMMFLLSMLSMAGAAQVKDVAQVYGVRDNPLVGYGIVTGLNRTGDSTRNEVTIRSLANRLQGLGVTLNTGDIQARNVAVIMATARLPSGARSGHRLTVEVSSVGDAKSLEGGVLQLTPLYGPDGQPYASAQGTIVVGGGSNSGGPGGDSATKNHPTVGVVHSGALVERENPNELQLDQLESVEWIIDEPSFQAATDIADAIDEALGGAFAHPVNSGTVRVAIPDPYRGRVVPLIARVEEIEIEVEAPSKVVVNERTGTVVMGTAVRIHPVAVAHGGLSIEVRRERDVSQPAPLSLGGTETVSQSRVQVKEEAGQLTLIEGATVGELVGALDAMGVTPRDLIQILLTIKKAGALQAEVEVM